jgi:hypothetical protein
MRSSADVRRLLARVHAEAWLTSTGWWTTAFAVVVLVVGWRLGWDELLVLGTALVLVVLLAASVTLGQAKLEVALRLRPQRLVVVERAAGEVTVTNAGGRVLFPMRIELPVGGGVAQFDVPALGRGESDEQTFVIPTSRRSIVDVGPVRSVRGDALQLVRREVVFGEGTHLYVHPRTADLSGVAAGWLRDLEGQSTDDLSPSDLAFHTLRDYVPGDDRRHVHWRTTARVGRLMVRQYVDTRRSHLVVVLDTDPGSYADEDEFELAVSIAASLGRRTLIDENIVSAVAGQHVLPCHAPETFMDAMSGVELGDARAMTLPDATTRAVRVASGASVAALVTGERTSAAVMRLATERFAPNVRCFGLRAVLGGTAQLRRSDRLTMLTVPDLEALPFILWSAGNR